MDRNTIILLKRQVPKRQEVANDVYGRRFSFSHSSRSWIDEYYPETFQSEAFSNSNCHCQPNNLVVILQIALLLSLLAMTLNALKDCVRSG